MNEEGWYVLDGPRLCKNGLFGRRNEHGTNVCTAVDLNPHTPAASDEPHNQNYPPQPKGTDSLLVELAGARSSFTFFLLVRACNRALRGTCPQKPCCH